LISRLSLTAKQGAVLIATALCAAIPACDALQRISPFRTQPAPATLAQQAATPTPSAQPTAAQAETKKPRRTLARAKPKATPVENGPVLSLAPGPDPPGQQSSEQHAQTALDEATRELATVDRSRLEGQKVDDYDLVTGLMKGAQEALHENDFVKAESLGEKAAVLARLLATTGAAAR